MNNITYGIAQNGKLYVEAAPGQFEIGDIVEKKGRFAAVTRKRRGGPAPHPAGDLIRKLKVEGAGDEFNAAPLGDAEKQMRQRFYCEVIDEQRIYDAE